MNYEKLFEPIQIGDLHLPNRMVMAPMTRNRADAQGVPTDLMAEYYAQRATAGLIVTEATQVSDRSNGYLFTPGIYTQAQADGWRKITRAVHQAGGRILLQLWHTGRVSHPSLQPNGDLPLAPSAINAHVQAFTSNGFEPTVTPRGLALEEIPEIVSQFTHAATLAKSAGFDGVEIHGANGYLIDQFLKDGSNRRSDGYGGDISDRIRFALEVVTAVVEVWGPNRVGLRLSPRGTFNSMYDSDPRALFSALVHALAATPLAYLHLIEPLPGHPTLAVQEGIAPVAPALRKLSDKVVILNGGYDQERAALALGTREADLVAFGVPYLANPDLVERFRRKAELNEPDLETFYGGDATGYTDYPFLK